VASIQFKNRIIRDTVTQKVPCGGRD